MNKRYTPEFRAEAIKQVTERGYAVADVAKRLGVSGHSLYAWLRKQGVSRYTQGAAGCRSAKGECSAASRAAPRRGGTRHSKKGRRVLCQGVKAKYGFMRDHRNEFRAASMCRVLKVERSGSYVWLAKPLSARAIDDARILKLIEEAYLTSGGLSLSF